VESENKVAKFWLEPVRVQRSGGFKQKELNTIHRLVEENEDVFIGKWDDYFAS